MLLEIENALFSRVHEAVGQSAVIVRLAESLEESGSVAENTNIVVSFSNSSMLNPNKGAYIPTVRFKEMTFTITIIQKQSQRSGHSFALPILDIICDYVTGWVPCLKGLKFQTGFEFERERFIQITEASQYVYEQTYKITAYIPDGRMVSSTCAISEPLNLCDYLPSRKCLVTKEGKRTSLALWKIKTGENEYDEFIVVDTLNCPAEGELTYECSALRDGTATYRFVPYDAYLQDSLTGQLVLDETKVVIGNLVNFVECLVDPPNVRFKVYTNLWKNSANKVGERLDPRYVSIVPTNLDLFVDEQP